MASTANEKYAKIYVETIMRADGIERVRARWTNPITGKPSNKVLGFRSEFSGKLASNKKLQDIVDELRITLNKRPKKLLSYTVHNLIADYYDEELVLRQEGEDTGYSWSYIIRTKPVISLYIQPKWGKEQVQDIGRKEGLLPYDIEKWIDKLKREDGRALSRGTRAKVKFTMQALLNYARAKSRYEGVNPLKGVSCSAKRVYDPDEDGPRTLTVEQFDNLVAMLDFLPRLLVFFDMTTGLRRSEIQGLKWKDIDFLGFKVKVKRGFVDGVAGDCKSEASHASVPLKPEVAEMLKMWWQLTSHNPDDYVFTAQSNRSGKERRGKTPLALTRFFQYWIEPVAKELGISVWRFGWHTFRRTFVTWCAAANDNPRTVMGLARHASVKMTYEIYDELKEYEGREAHAKGLAKLAETLKYYSQPSLCVAIRGFGGTASDGTIVDVAEKSAPSTSVPVV